MLRVHRVIFPALREKVIQLVDNYKDIDVLI